MPLVELLLKSAINETEKKRHERLTSHQNDIGKALLAVGRGETFLLQKRDKNNDTMALGYPKADIKSTNL